MKSPSILTLLLFFIYCPLFAKATASKDSCPSGFYHVKSHFRRGYIRSDGTLVKATNVKSYCKEASAAYNFWMSKLKRGSPTDWPHKQEEQSSWTSEEEQRVLEALENIPEELWTDAAKAIFRLKKSKDFPNPASNGDGLIILYDSAFDSKRNLARILAHELAHISYQNLSKEDAPDYRRATNWGFEVPTGRVYYWKGRDSGYVAEDGKISPEEDYANNIEYFLFEPEKLKEKTPAAYSWIKKHFGDKFKLKGGKK